ncbi:hypothetical protein AZ46_0218830 [Metabacillus indicus LMG 22858]|nr:hypothetical protein AZ46_0218830 [Metabacillus indicus LMG 22858]
MTFPLVFFSLIALIGENGTINSEFCLVGGTYPERMEPSTDNFVWLMVLIGENGTSNRQFRLVDGTYRGAS